MRKTVLGLSVLAMSACAPNSFTETIAPTLVPPADLAKYRCEQLGLVDDKDCLLKQYDQIVTARAEERKAAAQPAPVSRKRNCHRPNAHTYRRSKSTHAGA